MAPSQPRGRRPAPARVAPQPPRLPPRQTLVFAGIAALVVCSLIAGLLGTVVMDAAAPPPAATRGPADDGPSAYEATMRTAIAGNPADASALVSLANLLALRGELPETIDLYERALAVEPGNAETRRAFAFALSQAGSLADAELQYRRVLEANPDDAEALFFLGQLYERWSPPRTADAADAYRRAAAAEPGSVSADQAVVALARLPEASPVAVPAASPTAP
jgi:cytochrome c-type biogenesis protein CcmH/NrfG